ncbi:hypothetical protein Tco_0494840 [Tanacetum coccineum]
MGCVGKEAALTEKLVVVEKEKDELLDKNWAQEEHIKRLEETLASKTSSLSEAESTASALKGDLERLTIDLSYAEIVRHNYVRQLLPNVFQRLLSSEEYKKTLSDVFKTKSIVAGWSIPLALGLVRSVLRYGKYFHLVIGAWTHPERLAFRGIFITWPLALGLIRSVLRSGEYSFAWSHPDRLNVLKNIRLLANGNRTSSENVLRSGKLFFTWPLATWSPIRSGETLSG